MPWSWLAIAVLAILLLVAVLAWWWERTRPSRASRARLRVAAEGERDALDLLESAGFELVDRQITETWTLWVDDEPVEVRSRADLLVQRDGRRFVAEVKTGELVPNPTHPATRRQLLEYLLAFSADGVVLVDMHEQRLREVRFDRIRPQTRPG